MTVYLLSSLQISKRHLFSFLPLLFAHLWESEVSYSISLRQTDGECYLMCCQLKPDALPMDRSLPVVLVARVAQTKYHRQVVYSAKTHFLTRRPNCYQICYCLEAFLLSLLMAGHLLCSFTGHLLQAFVFHDISVYVLI